MVFNFGQDSTFSGATTAGGNTDANGIGDFKYAPPTGFLALCSANLPTPTIIDGSEHFNTVLYTGDDSTQAITGVGFGSAPDLTWIKNRAAASTHRLYNSLTYGGPVSAGSTTNYLASNSTSVETASASTLISFDSDGFTVHGSGNDTNDLTETYTAWNWKAGGTAVSNTDGSITSQVSANVAAGFSIASYSGTGSAASFGHGLATEPSMVIVKGRNVVVDWVVYHKDLGKDKFLYLNGTNAVGTISNYWGAGGVTNSVVGLNTYSGNNGSYDYIAYCFADVEGFSKAGSYTGNGSADGPFVYTGFRPSWIMWKRTDSSTGGEWVIQDTTRREFNPVDVSLYPNLTNAEATGETFRVQDTLSNGFKLRSSAAQCNASGGTYIYLAFAEVPFKVANAR
jgi:hypothetical protein